MDDLISRQAAIELIHSLYPSEPIMRINRKWWEEKYKPYIEAEKALGMLPSAKQNKTCEFWDSESSFCALNRPSAQQNRIARETAGKSPEEIYDFLHWLLIDYGRTFTDSRLAVIEWLKEENNG